MGVLHQSAEAKLDALEAAILVSPSDRRGADAGDGTDTPQQLDRLVRNETEMVVEREA